MERDLASGDDAGRRGSTRRGSTRELDARDAGRGRGAGTRGRGDAGLTESAERFFVSSRCRPDGVQRGVVGEIISRFENKGMVLKALKTYACPKAVAEEHYRDLSSKPFFGDLVDYICSGPVVAMIWEGPGAVKSARLMIGATNPLESAPGTIRGDLAVEVGRNVIHGSDSVESAEREIALWFGDEVGCVDWQPTITPWVRE